jgi:hypothetical protein
MFQILLELECYQVSRLLSILHIKFLNTEIFKLTSSFKLPQRVLKGTSSNSSKLEVKLEEGMLKCFNVWLSRIPVIASI